MTIGVNQIRACGLVHGPEPVAIFARAYEGLRRRRELRAWCRVSPSSVQTSAIAFLPSPDNHFAAGPDCRVTDSSNGRIPVTSGYPTVGGWIVSAATVQIWIGTSAASGPYKHFTARPNCGVTGARRGR